MTQDQLIEILNANDIISGRFERFGDFIRWFYINEVDGPRDGGVLHSSNALFFARKVVSKNTDITVPAHDEHSSWFYINLKQDLW